tara:strand:- start:6 stop:164 length:159 start_codon:yes stop_codon:yes gene_type:complete
MDDGYLVDEDETVRLLAHPRLTLYFPGFGDVSAFPVNSGMVISGCLDRFSNR